MTPSGSHPDLGDDLPDFDPEATLPPPGSLAAEELQGLAAGLDSDPDAAESESVDTLADLDALNTPVWSGTQNYSTLADVRDHLVEEADADEQAEALDRVLGRARRRLEGLRARGMRPRELEGRLTAAEVLARQHEPRAALLLVEEVLVLAKVMAEHGEAADPVELLISERLDEALRALLRGRDLGARINELAGVQIEARADQIHAQVDGDTEARLTALLGEERFKQAAAKATASHPYPLLDRPETLARIDAVAQRRERGLLESSAFFEQVDRLIRQRLERFLDDPSFEERVQAHIERQLLTFLDSAAFGDRIADGVEEHRKEWTRSQEFAELLESQVETLVSDELQRRLRVAAAAPAAPKQTPKRSKKKKSPASRKKKPSH